MRTPPTRSRGLTALAALVLMSSAGEGCAASHRGLIEPAGAAGALSVTLRTPDGRGVALRSAEDLDILRALEGCTIEVEGSKVLGSLIVREWRVIEAGDGSAPYVGVLRQHGMNLVIDDRNSGMPLVLDDASAARFGTHAGEVVMISGYVVGAQLLHVVNFRVLVE